MTREEFRDKKSKDYRKRREAYGINDPVYLDEIEEAYYQGMVDADVPPRWISVGDELPKEHEWILGFSLKRSYIDVYNFDSNGLFEAHDITHWMHLSPPPVLSKSGNTGKNHLIDANNMVDHFADISKMVEKGGEE